MALSGEVSRWFAITVLLGNDVEGGRALFEEEDDDEDRRRWERRFAEHLKAAIIGDSKTASIDEDERGSLRICPLYIQEAGVEKPIFTAVYLGKSSGMNEKLKRVTLVPCVCIVKERN